MHIVIWCIVHILYSVCLFLAALACIIIYRIVRYICDFYHGCLCCYSCSFRCDVVSVDGEKRKKVRATTFRFSTLGHSHWLLRNKSLQNLYSICTYFINKISVNHYRAYMYRLYRPAKTKQFRTFIVDTANNNNNNHLNGEKKRRGENRREENSIYYSLLQYGQAVV